MTTENTDDFGLDADSITKAFADVSFDEAEESPDDDATTQSEEDSEAEEEQEQTEEEQEEDTKPEGWKPDGPGDLKVALKQARTENAQLAQRLAAIERREAEQAAAQRQAEERQYIQQQVQDMDPEDVPAYLEQVQQHQAKQLQDQMEQQQAWDRLKQSETFARASFPDYDAQIEKLSSVFGADVMARWALTQPIPANAAYQAAKGFFTQSDIEAAREEGRKEALGLAGRTQVRKPSASPRLGNIPASASSKDPNPNAALSKRLAKGGDVSEAVSDMFANALKG